jgi:hypothetical protein
MMKSIDLSKLLSGVEGDATPRLGLFALLSLGVVELLTSGALSSEDATRFFFNAENGLYVRKKLRDKMADRIMSHGVQLQDLFEVLPGREAQQEFQRELGSIRSLCLQLLDQHELVA